MNVAAAALTAVVEHRVQLGQLPPFWVWKQTGGPPRAPQAIENSVARQLARTTERISTEVVRAVQAAGRLPRSAVEAQAVMEAFNSRIDELATTVGRGVEEAGDAGGRLVVRDAREFGVSASFDDVPRELSERLGALRFEASQGTMRAISGDLTGKLVEIAQAGLGIDEAAVELRAVFTGLSDGRLRLIARTEVQGAQNEVGDHVIRLLNFRFKQWLTSLDDRVREQHVRLHGQVIRSDVTATFTNGLRRPTERSGPAVEWINCRCRVRPYQPPKGKVVTVTPFFP